MNDKKILQHYCNVAQVLGEMFKPSLEVLVHDLRDPAKSIICIYNGHITGRKVGDSTTDLGLRRVRGEDVPDMIISYENRSPSGSKLKSSSLAIRNEKNKIIGALCLNFDLALISSITEILNIISSTTLSKDISQPEKFTPSSAVDETEHALQNALNSMGLTGKILTLDDKRTIIKKLFKDNVFNKRGAAVTIAKLLKITRASVYNYLKE